MLSKLNFFKKRNLTSLAIVASLVAGGYALAKVQTNSPLHNTMTAYVVQTDQAGQEFLQATNEVEPGQTVEYELVYQNQGDSLLKDLVITGPIPAATDYIANSAVAQTRANLQVSIDGGKQFESEPVIRIITDASGKQVQKVIPPSEYTHVRWVMQQPLHAGETQKFAYRSIVK